VTKKRKEPTPVKEESEEEDETEEEEPVPVESPKKKAKAAPAPTEDMIMLPESSDEEEEDDDEDDELEGEEEVGKEVPEIEQKTLALVKKSTKHISKKKEEEVTDIKDRGTIYLGHIPFGFFEDEMRGFFSQFGTVSRIRLARSKKTGRSKGYAWIEFAHAEVAEVVSKVMQGYLLYGKVLSSRVVPPAELHKDVFKGANRKFKLTAWRKLARERFNTSTEENSEKKAKNAQKKKAVKKSKKKKLQAKLKELGVEYEFP